jgi:hypothetical protein
MRCCGVAATTLKLIILIAVLTKEIMIMTSLAIDLENNEKKMNDMIRGVVMTVTDPDQPHDVEVEAIDEMKRCEENDEMRRGTSEMRNENYGNQLTI